MGRLCDFCGEQRSMVYCRSDAACLCLSCDRNIHSANALSSRHSRTLVCERCNSQPAAVRCIEEEISLCQNCNWSSHPAPASAAGLKQQPINCYSGCPSAAELSSVWSFFSAGYSSCNPEIGSISLEKEEQRISYHSLPPMDYSITEVAVDRMASDVDKFSGKRFLNSLSEKGGSSRRKHLETFDEDDGMRTSSVGPFVWAIYLCFMFLLGLYNGFGPSPFLSRFAYFPLYMSCNVNDEK